MFLFTIFTHIYYKNLFRIYCQKNGQINIIADKVKQVLFRYCPETLNPSGCLSYMQGHLIFWYLQYLYAVSGANDSECDGYGWMGTDSVCFSGRVSTFQMNLLPSP